MNVLATVIILLGLMPGAVLPAELVGRFIVPAVKVEAAEDQPTPAEDANGAKPDKACLHAGSSYTAIRPAGFSFTKADLRAIQLLHERLESSLFDQASGVPLASVHGHQAIMQPDHCRAHEMRVTSPPISPQAPPLSTIKP